jgi:carbon monoxide dehydrogenase subunit G
MAAQYSSKHGYVGRNPMELYMAFTDLRNFKAMMPASEEVSVEADYDTLTATAKGMTFSLKVTDRQPYSKVSLESFNSPLAFTIDFHFNDIGGGRTDFFIEVDAQISGMIKMMLGGKIKEALDKIVDGMVSAGAQI